MNVLKLSFAKSRFLILALAAFPMLAACGDEGPTGTSTASSSSHNPGTDCRGCHDLAYAGTVIQSLSSSSGVSGVTVTVTEASGAIVTMVSDRSGNFYASSGSPTGGYTVNISGSNTQMVGQPTNGGCNTGGCHDGRANPQIYLN
ncbi:MAG: hypothetical protein OEY50_11660 [Nitrospinota bacterium]|nr:hypothetical protein [Nitrospinota bacterium]MDH5679678.1 hypothetical protein [Nitrospinota bacterium]